ncbi:MAG TPA: nucleotide pyrophosphohydrolase [Candidatus Bathyarchaeia archaeon]|nr:nucleotide pyrophosphohydrolase [Candidatus Bathyarchaeia archaeon]
MKDSVTEVEQLKLMVKKFSDDRDWDKYHNAKDLAIGVVTESSELLQRFRFKSDKEIDSLLKSPKARLAIGEEIADTLYFLLRLAQRYDFDLSTELQKKIEKNETRYPIKTAKGSNKKYDELTA